MEYAAKLSGLSLIKQYLKTEQSAADILEARSGDLVEAMPFLLQLVNRQAEALSLAVHELGLEPDAIWNAVVRLLKNIYFAYPDDEYRVLGLNPWCQVAEARERHRHLIRLFHPDRGLLASAADEPDFSAVINRAYTNIINGNHSPNVSEYAAGTRQHSYSPKLKLGRHSRYKLNPRGQQIHMAAVAAALGIYKLTPRSVWLALIIISLAFIAQNYWNSQYQVVLVTPEKNETKLQPKQSAENRTQKVTPVAKKLAPTVIESNMPTASAEIVAPDVNSVLLASLINPVAATATDVTKKNVAALKLPPAVVTPFNVQAPVVKVLSNNDAQPIKQEIAKPALAAATDKTVQKSVLAEKIQIERTKKAVPAEYQLVKKLAQQAAPVKVVNSQIELAEVSQQTTNNSKPAGNAVVNKEAVTNHNSSAATVETERKTADNAVQVTQAVTRQATLSNEELDRLIKNLIASYNNGDIEAFMQLLEDDVKTDEAGGKNGLRQAYAKLFRKTTQREMQLKDLNWRRNGEVAATSSKYVVSITPEAASEPKIHRGVLQFEVVRREGRPMIHALYHLPEGNDH